MLDTQAEGRESARPESYDEFCERRDAAASALIDAARSWARNGCDTRRYFGHNADLDELFSAAYEWGRIIALEEKEYIPAFDSILDA